MNNKSLNSNQGEGAKIIQFPRKYVASPEEQDELKNRLLKINKRISNLELELELIEEALSENEKELLKPEWKKRISRMFGNKKINFEDILSAEIEIKEELEFLNNEKKSLEEKLGPEALAEMEQVFGIIKDVRNRMQI